MESITIKVDEKMAKAIDKAMKNHYSTKTEFIREAIRDKLEEIELKRDLRRIDELAGSFKPKTNKSLKEIRKEVGKEVLKRFNIDPEGVRL